MSVELPTDPDILGLIISNAVLNRFGFGPSQSICKPFAEQVIAEAKSVGAVQS